MKQTKAQKANLKRIKKYACQQKEKARQTSALRRRDEKAVSTLIGLDTLTPNQMKRADDSVLFDHDDHVCVAKPKIEEPVIIPHYAQTLVDLDVDESCSFRPNRLSKTLSKKFGSDDPNWASSESRFARSELCQKLIFIFKTLIFSTQSKHEMNTQTIIENAVGQIMDDIATFLVSQKGLFAKKMTKAALLKLMKTVVDDVDEKETVADEIAFPEGWTAESWASFEKKRAELKDKELINVTSRVVNGKNPKGLLVDQTWRVCATKTNQEKFDAIIEFLKEHGDVEKVEESDDDDDDKVEKVDDESDDEDVPTKKQEESDDDEEDEKPAKGKAKKEPKKTAPNLIDEYDYNDSKLKNLKKVLDKVDGEETFANVKTVRTIKKNPKNEKEYEFVEKVAIPKMPNAKDMAKHVKKVLKMLEDEE